MKIFITGNSALIRCVFLKNNQIEYFFIEKNPSDIFVGNIYKGRIEKILKGLNAAFVNIGEPTNGFLHFDQKEMYFYEEDEEQIPHETNIHKVGEEILVQVTKPGKELKGMKLTTRITIPGKYLVLIPSSKIRTISKKIKNIKEKKRLIKIMEKYIPGGTGFIVRTYADGKNEKFIIKEIKYLLREWRRIEKTKRDFPSPFLIWKELPLHLRVIRDFVDENIVEIVVEGEDFYEEVKKYIKTWCPEVIKRLKFYKENIPLFEKYNLNKKIMKFLSEKVHLHSGGYLLIEEGRTLTAIDVNTGSFEGNGYLRTIYNTNMEAADEIPRQIRVRNLSGLIIVDFIDMKDEREKRKVFEKFKKKLSEEKAKIKLLSLSELGLVEMSRERTGITLREFFYDECKKCEGTGYVKNLNMVLIELEEKICEYIFQKKIRRLKIKVIPEFFEFIFKANLFANLIKKKKVEFEASCQPGKHYFTVEMI